MDKVKDMATKVLHGDGHNQAAWLREQGAKLQVGEIEMPTPTADEVIIRARALAINPVDWKMQDYGLFIQSWPTVLGCDVAGEVHAVGSSVTRFKKGDRVVAHAKTLAGRIPRDGAHQHYVPVWAATTALIPQSISYKDASVLPLALDTAAVGLYRKREDNFLGLPFPSLHPTPNNKVIVAYGGSSSVGSLVIQLAVASGAKVVAVASSRNHAYCKKLGASEVVDYKNASVVEDIVKAVETVGGDFAGIFDAISEAHTYKITVAAMGKLGGGNMAVVLGTPENLPSNVKIGNVFGVDALTHPIWEQYLTPALEHGKLQCVPEALVVGKGLEEIQKGLDKSKEGISASKVVVEL